MHSWKKKLVVSQLALACTLAITSQANATTYNTFGYHDDADTAFSWSDWENADNLNYITYNGYIYNNTTDGAYDQTFNGDVVNGVISTYYLNNDYADNTANTLNIYNSTIHGMITSELVYDHDKYGWTNGTDVDYRWNDGDTFNLNIADSTIDDDYEYFYFTDSYLDADGKRTSEDMRTADYAYLGTAVTLDVESNINITDNSRVAGITLSQGNTYNGDYATGGDSAYAHTWDNTITVDNSTVTSGAFTPLEGSGWYGNSEEPSDYSGNAVYDATTGTWYHNPNDTALSFSDDPDSYYSMKNNVTFTNGSTLMGDVVFTSNFNNADDANADSNGDGVISASDGFSPIGYDTNNDGVEDTNGGWSHDNDNVDELNLKLDNGSKWVGDAYFSYEYIAPADMYDLEDGTNSLEPSSTVDKWGNVVDDKTFQSGIFTVALDNGSEWDTVNTSNVDTLTVNNGSQVNVADSSSLIADTITLTNGSTMNLSSYGEVDTDHLTVDSYSKVDLTNETAYLYANTITVSNGGEFSIGAGEFDADSFGTDTLELTNAGVFNINNSDYVLNADLVNGHTNTADTSNATYGYGVIAMTSDGHLTVNGNGDYYNGDNTADTTYSANGEADNSYTDNVVAATGNYKVRIDNATGAGSVADYKGNELIRVNDVNTDATFSAANKADLGAYTYQAKQEGNTVVLEQMELTDYANMALSIPSANTNIWNLEQDTVGTRLTNARHGLADNGGAWVSYFGGNFNGDNGTINYDQDVNSIMVGVDTKVDGNNAKWIVGAAAGFAKGDLSDRTGQVDQDSQSAYIYSSARFANNIFVDGNLSYSHFNNDLSANMSDGTYVDGNTSSDAWGFGLKLGYDLKLGDAGYVTPYGSVSGLFQSGDDYQLSNDMKVDGQSYDSMRYELGVDAGYTFTYSEDQALTPYFKLAYVYDDSNNDADVNGDSIDNGVEGSAVRVGLGTQFSFTKNFSAYTDANYLGGGDVDQDWSANVGVKYTW
ncbi:autotransporter outer membrane beta-barrel domain-containing protein [Salmonella enterica]|uniref:autotransporter outer membrane beta-barrel domain-containing protein n=1 Tax=Salmonella enterica TaxID=28901 RepID=UPI000EBE4879|nr:autotransporter outer membrane beta-barrel domain-containing protein [Salmonella enterica]EIJ3069794.1 autotransporter outer membrane beta-barrel domain-containing protein [Salmonella enterica subsp. enterica serovar Lubbock]QBJ53138.1 autotransporter outer membrane beta-barrel domain-containing protein [Salmonella enterica subsp. enterica serovar Montevideo str. USDA-ARS-USMARC-1913]RJH19653.1 autotransporter outer membrane beta-barrel domain-containing protein [Salmonella enterica subsp. en